MSDLTSDKCPRKRIKLDEEEITSADEIASLCYQAYLQLGKSGKPSDAKVEHTVLAGIVESKRGNGALQPRVVALATGTKCFPQNVANRREEIVDCHAEPLLKRAFKCYLIEQLDRWLAHGNSIDQFHRKVLQHQEYCLFVSQTPCGCVSRWKGDEQESDKQPQPHLKSYKIVGINRKPGRGDLCPKAGCIHKVAKWNVFGLQGRSLLSLVGRAITLQKIVVGNCEQTASEFRFEEMLARLTVDQEELKSIKDQLHSPQLFNFTSPSNTQIEFASKFRVDEFVREFAGTLKRPTGSSIAAWLKESDGDRKGPCWLQCEVIASGRKLGVGRSKSRKELSIDTRPSDTTGELVEATNRSATVGETTTSKHHRPADLAVSDSALNQRVGQLVDRLHCRCAQDDTQAEDNDSRGGGEEQSAKSNEGSRSTDQMMQSYEHNWKLVRDCISIFQGWPSIPKQ